MKHETLSKRIAGLFLSGIIAIFLLTIIVPLGAYAGQGQHADSFVQVLALGAVAFGFVKSKEFNINGKKETLGYLNIDKGFYHDADKKKGAIVALEELYAKEAGEASIYTGLSHKEIHMKRKQLRAEGKEVPLTAFEKQLILHDIKINGALADPVEKFFSTTANSVLFPAYISDQILVAQLMGGLVNDFVHTRTTIDQISYDKVTMSETEENRQTKQKSEGANMREFTIVVGNRSVKVKKYAGILKASYDAIRFQKLPVFAKFIQRIAIQMEIDKTDELILTMKNGDGNSNAITSGRTFTQLAAGAITLADIINWSDFADAPYQIDKFVGLRTHIIEYRTALAGMNNPQVQLNFVGVNLPRAYKFNRTTSGLDTSTNAFYGVDSRFAIEEINNGPILVESDKLIDKQFERTAISESVGFVLDENAVFCFTAQ